ncbi:hypothetical protein JJC03_10020 [Flavobacterium oreochromis]|uniref:hypothetical protein n=1 Tax=Flavobacterium oreochromis TaxID=2906078 RepID=UPI001CE5C8CE|nr:hypothetical protein [Flavobacterium oreochromis]QYS85548.1 hypothetical protein JJC03_10020 [Flavobacterium oreochromis]
MKNYTLRLKNTSEAELQRFDQFMLQILRENYERKKAKAELNKFTPNYAITQHKTASKTIQKKAQPAIQKINKRGFIVAENGIRLHHTPAAYDAQYINKKATPLRCIN